MPKKRKATKVPITLTPEYLEHAKKAAESGFASPALVLDLLDYLEGVSTARTDLEATKTETGVLVVFKYAEIPTAAQLAWAFTAVHRFNRYGQISAGAAPADVAELRIDLTKVAKHQPDDDSHDLYFDIRWCAAPDAPPLPEEPQP